MINRIINVAILNVLKENDGDDKYLLLHDWCLMIDNWYIVLLIVGAIGFALRERRGVRLRTEKLWNINPTNQRQGKLNNR